MIQVMNQMKKEKWLVIQS